MPAVAADLVRFIQHAAVDIDPLLLTPAALARMLNVAKYLAQPSGEIVLELRLAATEAQADLTVVYIPDDLRTWLVKPPLGPARALADFAPFWLQPNHRLATFPTIAYECDISEEIADGFVYPYVQTQHLHGFYAVAAACHRERIEASPPQSLALAQAWIEHHVSDAQRNGLISSLQRCFAALGPASLLFHVALLEQRRIAPQSGLRVLVSVPRTAILSFLTEIAWSGNLARIEAALTYFCHEQARINFDLNFDAGGVSTRIGFFCDFVQPRCHDPRRVVVESYLREANLACPHKLAAVQAWVTSSAPTDATKRELGYKLVCDGETMQAKVYLTYHRSASILPASS